jgi:hypothetical protein
LSEKPGLFGQVSIDDEVLMSNRSQIYDARRRYPLIASLNFSAVATIGFENALRDASSAWLTAARDT